MSIRADSDQTINNTTTLTDSNELKIKLNSNTKYLIGGLLVVDTSTVADLDYTFKAISGTTIAKFSNDNDVSIDNFGEEHFVAGDDPAGSETGVYIRGAVFTGETGGLLHLQFAQNTGEATDTKIIAGSFISVLEVM